MRKGQIALGCMAISVLVVHTAAKRMLAAIVPDPLPAKRQLVLVAGATAAIGGAAVMVPATRRTAAWGLVAWLIAVYPANVWMAVKSRRYRPVPPWMLWARLPFQFPMIWWAYQYTKPDRELAE
jgi:uncharacterized membrane protein